MSPIGKVSFLAATFSIAAFASTANAAGQCNFNHPLGPCQVQTAATPLGQAFEVVGAQCASIDYQTGNRQRRILLTNGQGHDARPLGPVSVLGCVAYAPLPAALPAATIQALPDPFINGLDGDRDVVSTNPQQAGGPVSINQNAPKRGLEPQVPTQQLAKAPSAFGHWCSDFAGSIEVSAAGLKMERADGAMVDAGFIGRDRTGYSYEGFGERLYSGKISLTMDDQLLWRDTVSPGDSRFVVLNRC